MINNSKLFIFSIHFPVANATSLFKCLQNTRYMIHCPVKLNPFQLHKGEETERNSGYAHDQVYFSYHGNRLKVRVTSVSETGLIKPSGLLRIK